ncbi:tetratricopeptide repeat protein [Candidatus Liberibacter brunswickensis]
MYLPSWVSNICSYIFIEDSKRRRRCFLLSAFVVSVVLLTEGCFYPSELRRRVNISSLTSVIHSHPSDPEGYNVRGVVYGMNGDFKNALIDFQSALDLNPRYYKVYANRALIRYKMGDVSDAIKDYEAALKINPNYYIAYVGLGDIYRDERYSDLQKAFECFNRAIKLETYDERAWYGRALVYQMRGEHEKAIEDFSKAISLSSTVADYYNGRGVSYLVVKNYDRASDDFKFAIYLDPKKASFWFNAGVVDEIQHSYESAINYYEKALSVDSKYYKAIDGISRVNKSLNS